MGFSLYHIPRSKNTLRGATHFDIRQTATIWSLELESIRILSKKLKESEKKNQNI